MKDSTKQLIEDAGYRLWEEGGEPDCYHMRYQKRIWDAEELGIPLCLSNDNVCVNLDYSRLTFRNSGYEPVTSELFQISLCNERPNDEWCDFKIYSLTEEQIVSKLSNYEESLKECWKTFYSLGES